MDRVVVVPAGRRQYLEMLFGHLMLQKESFDYLDIWQNTRNAADLAYIQQFSEQHNFVRIRKFKPYRYVQRCGTSKALGWFWRYSCDANSAYFRLDDDVVWLEPGTIDAVFTAREKDQKSWFISPVVVNNAICSRLLQQANKLPTEVDDLPFVQPVSESCICDIGWRSVDFANWLHQQFFDALASGNIEKFHLPKDVVLDVGLRYSINSICYFGRDIEEHIHEIANSPEEPFVSSELPQRHNRPIRIIGNKVIAHLAYHIQREDPSFHRDTITSNYRKLLSETEAKDAKSGTADLRQLSDESGRVQAESTGSTVQSGRQVLQGVSVSDVVPAETVPPVLRDSGESEDSGLDETLDERVLSRDVVGDAESVSQRSPTLRSGSVPDAERTAERGNKSVEVKKDGAKKSTISRNSGRGPATS